MLCLVIFFYTKNPDSLNQSARKKLVLSKLFKIFIILSYFILWTRLQSFKFFAALLIRGRLSDDTMKYLKVFQDIQGLAKNSFFS